MEVIQGSFGPRAPATVAADLRKLADDVDAGRVAALVASYERDGEYQLLWAASLESSLVLASLLQNAAVERFKI